MKKATIAPADGKPIEDAADDLEDSDVEDKGDESFIQSDEDELSGILSFCVSQALPASVVCGPKTSASGPDHGGAWDDTSGRTPMACGVGSQSAEDADLEDALGEWDDAEEELYLARLSQWESRQHLLSAADIVPGQVSSGLRAGGW